MCKGSAGLLTKVLYFFYIKTEVGWMCLVFFSRWTFSKLKQSYTNTSFCYVCFVTRYNPCEIHIKHINMITTEFI